MKLGISASFGFGLIIATAQAHAGLIEGPFVSGTGSYTTVNRGDMEMADSAQFWAFNATLGTTAVRTVAAAQNGGWGLKVSHPNGSFLPGQAFGTGQMVFNLVPGEKYVLSGFFRAEEGTGDVAVYLDQPTFPSFGLSGMTNSNAGKWYFGWTEFTQPTDTSNANIRLLRRHPYPAFSTSYFDDIAITSSDDFVPPTAVPEPGSITLLALGSLGLVARRGRKN